jgi:DNA polymerase-3 subunit epsilon
MQEGNGFFRRFLQSGKSNLLSVTAATRQGSLQTEALIRQMLKESRKEDAWEFPLLDTRYVVVDTETTGFNPNTDVLLSIGAVEMLGDQIVFDRSFTSFIQLPEEKRIPPTITKLTGITEEDVADAPPVSEAISRLLEFVGDGVLVMHHSAHDLRFLNAALWKLTRSHLTHRVIDTFDVAKWLYPKLNRYSLDDLLAFYNLSVKGRHTAVGDAIMTAQIWRLLIGEAVRQEVTTVGELYEHIVLSKL